MAQTPPNEHTGSIIKFLIYMCGVVLGWLSRLATSNNEQKLTIKIAITQTIMAALSAFVLWFILKKMGASDETKYISGAIVARYSDAFLKFIYMEFMNWIKRVPHEIEKLKL